MNSDLEKYTVIISKKASRLLVHHSDFMARKSIKAAQELVAEFEKSTHSLEIMPSRGAWLKGDFIPENTYRYLLFQKRYMLIYKIKGDFVYIDYVIDCREDYGWLIK